MNLMQFAERYIQHYNDNGAEWMQPIIQGLIESGLTQETLSAKIAEYNDLMFRPGTPMVDKGYYWSIRDRLKAILEADELFRQKSKNIFENC